MKIILLCAGAAMGGWLARMIAERIVLSRAAGTGLSLMHDEEPHDERVVYSLSFPDGSAVVPGRFQEWLDMIHDDEDIPEEEYLIAKAIIKKMRARLN